MWSVVVWVLFLFIVPTVLLSVFLLAHSVVSSGAPMVLISTFG